MAPALRTVSGLTENCLGGRPGADHAGMGWITARLDGVFRPLPNRPQRMGRAQSALAALAALVRQPLPAPVADPRRRAARTVSHDRIDREHRVRSQACPSIGGLGRRVKVFRIMQAATGIVLWTGSALDALAALDSMAHAAGYHGRARLPDRLRAGGLHVAEIDVGGAQGLGGFAEAWAGLAGPAANPGPEPMKRWPANADRLTPAGASGAPS
ncbi:hypothetical protein MMSR116_17245 [Methylobacterium mesophilicum SR1.6/6]|uniref:Uncharacterized protein n=1 Tax=Methylobacterium mesophilicum SR1.6/6 TaxID=908290 RepID=A0A6B9FR47_9HYPH|nr:hypothetical protein [Methylobacterium mesophilicum]QGY03445.1 hypothetical protein MMSR116_17245 [Methylobacterium mesophilicum SR1.6/6]